MPTADLDLTDAALQAAMANDIAELRGRFPETRALYREVCGLLFFRYGITPTANKLYQLVRKGSMGTPAEVLQGFWQELRGRTRVTIDHPDLPDALKEIAAGAVQTIWQAANEAATGELATLRAEARAAASAAEAGVIVLSLQNDTPAHEIFFEINNLHTTPFPRKALCTPC